MTTLWEEITDIVKKEQEDALAKIELDDGHILESLNSADTPLTKEQEPLLTGVEENYSDEDIPSQPVLGEKPVKRLAGLRNGPVKTKTRRVTGQRQAPTDNLRVL